MANREEPPAATKEDKNVFDLEEDDDDDLFKSAIANPGGGSKSDDQGDKEEEIKLNDEEEEEEKTTSSGYGTTGGQEVVHSNTMDDIVLDQGGASVETKTSALDLESDEDDLFKSASAGLEPEPAKRVNGASFTEPPPPATLAPADKEISLDDDDQEPDEEDKYPFKDAHLQPQLQLSGANNTSTPAAGAAANIDSTPNVSHIEAGKSSVMEGFDENERKELESGDDFIHVKVTSPHKVGEGMSSYLAYNVTTRTNSNYFKKKEMNVIRRFSDFLGLHEKLCEKYRQNGRIIPPAPDKNVVGTTKVKMSHDGEEGQNEFVERRRAALERYMNRTAAHPSLRTDPDFREFLELESDLPKSKETATLSGRNVMKLINKVGDSLSSITLKMEETDEWFEEKSQTIEQLDIQLKKLHMATEDLAGYRKNLASSTGNISKSLAVLSGCEQNSALSGAIAQLSTVHERIEKIHNDQASADYYFLSELIKDHIGLVGAVKDVFQERIKAWQAWQSVTSNLIKKREAKVKAELSQRTDKIGQLRQEIQDLERQQDMAQENFERISRQIKKEVELFDLRKATDFKNNILRYLESMLKAQEKMAEQWERYLPEIQQIRI